MYRSYTDKPGMMKASFPLHLYGVTSHNPLHGVQFVFDVNKNLYDTTELFYGILAK